MCCLTRFQSLSDTDRKVLSIGGACMLLFVAVVVGSIWPTLAWKILFNQFELREGTRSYDAWIDVPVPIYFELYLYNWTNPEEIGNYPDVKPHLVQMGPYTFEEKHERANVVWNSNHTVTFNLKRTWFFNQQMSNGSLSDEVTSLNPIAATLAFEARNGDRLTGETFDIFIKTISSTRFVYTRTAREWLFDGFQEDLLTFIKVNVPSVPIPFSTFGWFVERNESETFDGTFTMNTGTDDINRLGYLTHWNGERKTTHYRGKCGEVRGTTGEIWPPLNGKFDVSVFASDTCGAVTLKYDSKYTVRGIKGFKWVGDDRVFDNGVNYPEQECWCGNHEEFCPDLAPGVLNVTSCKYGAPAFLSYPHFYLANETYLNAIDGLNPRREEHEFYMALEPTTGIPLEVRAQMQINILLVPNQYIEMFQNVPNILIPVMWFRQRVTLSQSLARDAKLALMLPKFGVWLSYGIAGIGMIVLLVALYYSYVYWNNEPSSEDDSLINN